MLTQNDETGVVTTPRARRSTAVSQTLRAIERDVWSGRSGREGWPIAEKGDASRYRILVASDRATRERAYRLAHRVYQRAGFASHEERWCVAPYDARMQTMTLLIEDENGKECATISLVFDSSAGLPCDEIYHEEAATLRAQECRLAEVTRLAIDESCAGMRDLLLHMFNQCYIFARLVRGQSDLLIEVNPRHLGYYQRLLRFQQVGPERACSRVQGAPAVLLRLNFAEVEAAVKGTGCTGGRDLNGRRLHAYPYSQAEEIAVASFLARNHKPMANEEARYFGIDVA